MSKNQCYPWETHGLVYRRQTITLQCHKCSNRVECIQRERRELNLYRKLGIIHRIVDNTKPEKKSSYLLVHPYCSVLVRFCITKMAAALSLHISENRPFFEHNWNSSHGIDMNPPNSSEYLNATLRLSIPHQVFIEHAFIFLVFKINLPSLFPSLLSYWDIIDINIVLVLGVKHNDSICMHIAKCSPQ